MSVCDKCRKRTYCKKECRPAREGKQAEIQAALFMELARKGLLSPVLRAEHPEIFKEGTKE